MLQVDERAANALDGPIPSDVFVEVVRMLIVALTTMAGDAAGGGPGAALGACSGYVVGGVLGRWLRQATGRLEASVDRTPVLTLVSGAMGALVSSSVGVVLGIAAVVLLPDRWGFPVLGVAAWTGVYAGFRIGARKGPELLVALQRAQSVLPEAAAAGLVLVDSSAAMDGRLLAIARAGFLPGPLAVPRFVVDELQGLADAADPTRRRRARAGLETLEALRLAAGTPGSGPPLVVLPDEVPERDEVDAKLVALALRSGASVLTADQGLRGVAGVEGVRCLDIARLADGLRPGLVPGEVVRLLITREGRDPGQGVGFLADGTMVVVAGGAAHVGEEVAAEVTAGVPTSKGRLYFATLSG